MSGKTKLSREDLLLIEALVCEREILMEQVKNLSNKAIADKFCVSATTVSAIINGSYSYESAK